MIDQFTERIRKERKKTQKFKEKERMYEKCERKEVI